MSIPSPSGGPARRSGLALVVASGASNQVGAAVGSLAFPVIGPAGVVAVRQWIAGVVLLAAVRPRVGEFTRSQWSPVILIAVAFGTMNLALYSAIDRIGLGLAVTLEFLGPLAVALLGSRRPVDLACGATAGLGVLILARPQPTTDYAGIALALLAAGCWAAYILVSRTAGKRLPGADGPATAAGLSALLYLPVGILVLLHRPPTGTALAWAAAAGVLASAVPMLSDLLALRRIPARSFGILMSIHPVLAAGAGWVVLGQSLPLVSVLGIGLIVAANAGAMR